MSAYANLLITVLAQSVLWLFKNRMETGFSPDWPKTLARLWLITANWFLKVSWKCLNHITLNVTVTFRCSFDSWQHKCFTHKNELFAVCSTEQQLVPVPPEELKNYYKSIADNKEVNKTVMMLASAANSFRNSIKDAMVTYMGYSFLWKEDREMEVQVGYTRHHCHYWPKELCKMFCTLAIWNCKTRYAGICLCCSNIWRQIQSWQTLRLRYSSTSSWNPVLMQFLTQEWLDLLSSPLVSTSLPFDTLVNVLHLWRYKKCYSNHHGDPLQKESLQVRFKVLYQHDLLQILTVNGKTVGPIYSSFFNYKGEQNYQ